MLYCDECGDSIFIGDEYYHDLESHRNFHLSCLPQEGNDPKIEKRYNKGGLDLRMDKITWGQYKDHFVTDPAVPTSYLEWCTSNFKDGAALAMIKEELKRRSEGSVGNSSKLSRGQFAEQLMNLILKMPDGLNEQKVQCNGYEISIRKIL